jgi:DNA-binding protein HU-beta
MVLKWCSKSSLRLEALGRRCVKSPPRLHNVQDRARHRTPRKAQFLWQIVKFSTCTPVFTGLNTRKSNDCNKKQQLKITMAKALSKSQVAAAVADKNGLSKKQAAEILDSIAELAYKNAKNTFTLPGLGKLVLVNRKARVGRNPATGQPINIPAKRVVKFRVAKAAKDAILGAK